jgi:hypothetical protein
MNNIDIWEFTPNIGDVVLIKFSHKFISKFVKTSGKFHNSKVIGIAQY